MFALGFILRCSRKATEQLTSTQRPEGSGTLAPGLLGKPLAQGDGQCESSEVGVALLCWKSSRGLCGENGLLVESGGVGELERVGRVKVCSV